MKKCDGEERHHHFNLETDSFVTHVHEHEIHEKNFNSLNHHRAVDHIGLDMSALQATQIDTKIRLGESTDNAY